MLWLGVIAGPAALLWRKWAAAAIILGSAALGMAPWVVEAYTSFGSLLQRWAAAGEVQGGIAPAPGFWYEFKAANGPAFCRPCDIPLDRPHLLIWWIALPVLALVSVRRWPVPVLAGLAMAAPYLFLVDYAAPRFLLPAYGLLVIPAAATVIRFRPLVRGAAGRSPGRPVRGARRGEGPGLSAQAVPGLFRPEDDRRRGDHALHARRHLRQPGPPVPDQV